MTMSRRDSGCSETIQLTVAGLSIHSPNNVPIVLAYSKEI